MKRTLGMLLLAATMSFGCNGEEETPVTIDALFPADGAVSGYAIDPAATDRKTANSSAIEVYDSFSSATGAVNGDTAPFQNGMQKMARQFYAKGTSKIMLRLWSFADAAKAGSMYDAMYTDSHYSTETWLALTDVSAKAKIANNGMFYRGEDTDGAYIIEARITKAEGMDVEDATAKADLIAFMKAAAEKIK